MLSTSVSDPLPVVTCGAGGGGAATVTPIAFCTSIPAWFHTSTVIVSPPWLAPAV